MPTQTIDPAPAAKKKRRGAHEGSIFKKTISRKRADGTLYTADYWCASLSLPNGKRKDVYARTRTEVSQKLQAAQRALHHGTLATGPRQTLAQFLHRWLEDTVKTTTRPRTYMSYAERVKLHILPMLGKTHLSKLTSQQIQTLYATRLASGLSPATVNGIHVVLHRALRQAVKFRLIEHNPAEAVEAPQPEHPEAMGFKPEEIVAFTRAIQGDDYAALWLTFLTTGLRFGEAAALRWSDVDLAARTLTVRHTITRHGNKGYAFTEPKTPKSKRTIPLANVTVEALLAQKTAANKLHLRARRWADLDLVFPSSVGTPLRESHMIVVFHKTLERAGLARRRIHDLRHAYGASLFLLNVHPRAAQALLGHSSVDLTMSVYTAAVPEVLRQAADSLDVLYRPAV